MEATKAEKALRYIKAIVDAWYNDTLVVVGNDEECNLGYGECTIDSAMGMISNHVYAGLQLDIPTPKYLKK